MAHASRILQCRTITNVAATWAHVIVTQSNLVERQSCFGFNTRSPLRCSVWNKPGTQLHNCLRFHNFTVLTSDNDEEEQTGIIEAEYASSGSGKTREKLSTEKLEQQLITEAYDEIVAVGPRRRWTAAEWTELGLRFAGSRHLCDAWPKMLLNYITHKTAEAPGLFDVGMSLIEYVGSTGVASSFHPVHRLVATISICVHQGGKSQHAAAFAAYDELHSTCDIFDAMSALLLVEAFAKTKRWRLCLDFVEMAKLTTTPGAAYYSPIVVAALIAGDHSTADDVLKMIAVAGFSPTDQVFSSMIDLGMTSKLLEVLRQYSWIPSKDIADRIVQHMTSRDPDGDSINVDEAKVDRGGHCRSCGLLLEPLAALTPSQFSELRAAFLQKSLLRDGNVFLGSSPKEVSLFEAFLDRHRMAPFDVILDGLNVAFATFQKASPQQRSNLVDHVVKYFLQKGRKVLVLGRKHMSTWKCVSSTKSDRVEWFLTENVSKDDPFMLYSALFCGQKTYIVTNDELRDHRFLLGTELAAWLKTWQRGHQVMFRGLGTNGVLRFKWPDVHSTIVQQRADTWHIPFETTGEERTSYQLPQTWYCVRRRGGGGSQKASYQKLQQTN